MVENDLGHIPTGPFPEFLSHDDVIALHDGTHVAPFDVLGSRKSGGRRWIVTFQPDAVEVIANVAGKQTLLPRISGDVFGGPVAGKAYTLTMRFADGSDHTIRDTFSFDPILTDFDQYLVGEGTHKELWRVLGAHVTKHQRVDGVHFAVWAPNARRVSVVGDFNHWDSRRHPMRPAGQSGVWEVFLPHVADGALYKYELVGAHGEISQRADPVGFGSQHPPEKASIVRDISGFDSRAPAGGSHGVAPTLAIHTRSVPFGEQGAPECPRRFVIASGSRQCFRQGGLQRQ